MTFEQKLKAAALEAALHPALRHAAKNPARTARNLVEFTAGVAGGLFDDAQKAKLYDAVYPMLQEADREHLFALLEHAAGLWTMIATPQDLRRPFLLHISTKQAFRPALQHNAGMPASHCPVQAVLGCGQLLWRRFHTGSHQA